MTSRQVVGRSVQALAALALLLGTLAGLIAESSTVDCAIPQSAVFGISLVLFPVGFIWLVWQILALTRPKTAPIILAMMLYFGISLVGLVSASIFSSNGDLNGGIVWFPFWIIGILRVTGILPGSC